MTTVGEITDLVAQGQVRAPRLCMDNAQGAYAMLLIDAHTHPSLDSSVESVTETREKIYAAVKEILPDIDWIFVRVYGSRCQLPKPITTFTSKYHSYEFIEVDDRCAVETSVIVMYIGSSGTLTAATRVNSAQNFSLHHWRTRAANISSWQHDSILFISNSYRCHPKRLWLSKASL
jgi:hypothetical protein